MSTRVRQAFQSAAGAAGGAGLDVDEVFSTYLYNGTNADQTITNGIDLSTEGGMVWIKARSGTGQNIVYDTERGPYKSVRTNQTNSENTASSGYGLEAFNTDGFDLGLDWGGENWATDIASWTFRKAPKFFDVVTYTGNGANRSISHSLGSEPGMIIIKRTDSSESWLVYHRSLHPGGGSGVTAYFSSIELESSGGQYGGQRKWGAGTGEDHTASTFYVSNLGSINASGGTFVAYLFAHNDGDGGFGPDGDQDIIKCGSFTTASSVQMQSIDVGFEPQFVLLKCASSSDNWMMIDVMRGAPTVSVYAGESARLRANLTAAESTDTVLHPTATGFDYRIDNTSSDYIYIAIRRGPMAVPESATDVFAIDTYGGTSPNPPAFNSGFPVDMALHRSISTSSWQNQARLIQGKNLTTDGTGAEVSGSSAKFDYQDGFLTDTYVNSDWYGWMWKRAPGFFDVVAYKGNGTAGRTVSHNLGVAPEMIWVKNRETSTNWAVYHKDADSSIPQNKYLYLNTTGAVADAPVWNDTAPTDSQFTVGSYEFVNQNNANLVAYLFASLDGISKVGSYTGNGSSQTINCGFSAGARFVLIKNITAGNSNWFVFDTERGIVSGNDNTLYLNSTASLVTNEDCIDPHSSGFIVTNSNGYVDTNNSNQNYIFYAIA